MFAQVTMYAPIQVTALGAAVAAGVTAGVWKLGQKMGDITVYRWSLQIEPFEQF